MRLSTSEANKVLKEVGCHPRTHARVIGVTIQPEPDRALEFRLARRREYDGLRSLPFLSEEQSKRLEFLANEVVIDNHVAFEEDRRRR